MNQEEEGEVYEAYVLITSFTPLSDGWIRFSLQTTDPSRTVLQKYYQSKAGEVFKTGSTVWKVLLYKESDIVKSIQNNGSYCQLF